MRALRLLCALLVGTAIVVLVPVGTPAYAAPATATATAATTSTDPAVARLGACMATQHQADLLLMIDTSGSLGHAIDGQPPTDPTAVRVTAARYLLGQLSQSVRDVQLDVALAGFDVDLHPSTGWTPLDAGSLPSLDANLQTYATSDDGIDTDYTNAFEGALELLRAHDVGGTRCQAILWFTDGEFSIQPRETAYQRQFGTTKPYAPGVSITTNAGAAQATAEGQAALCRTGGIMDQVRAANIITLGVGLGVANPDFSLMQSVATSSAPNGTHCGTPSPNVAVGSFTLASNVDDILFAFDAFADPNALPTQAQQAICQLKPCSAARDFVLDSSISSVQVLADTTKPGVEVFLTPPGANTAVVLGYSAGAVTSPAIPGLSGTWINDHIVDLDLVQQSGAAWEGEWSVVFVDPNGSTPGELAKTSIRIVGDLTPTLVGSSSLQFRSGKTVTAHLGVVNDVTNKPVTQILGTGLLSAQLVPASGPPVQLASQEPIAQLGGGTPINLSSIPPGAATIDLVLDVTTKSPTAGVAGTALSPQLATLHIDVLPPLHFPSVGTHLDFGNGTGKVALHAALTAVGPGCVWVTEGAVSASPVDVRDVEVGPSSSAGAGPGSCLTLGAGQHGTVPVSLRLSKSGTGVVAGTLAVHLAPAGSASSAIIEPVSYIGNLVKPTNQAVLWSTFAIALLLGLALPIGFLYLARWRTARIPAGGLLVADFPIEITDSDVRRGGSPLAMSDHDCQYLAVPHPTRHLSPLPGMTLETRTRVNPLEAAYASVIAPGSTVVTAEGGGHLPAAVHGSWAVLLSDPDRQQGRLVLLLAANADAGAFDRVADQVRNRAPSQVAEARRLRVPGGAGDVSVGSKETGGWGFEADASPSESARGATTSTGTGRGWGEPDQPVTPATPSAPSSPHTDGGSPQSSGPSGWW